MPDCPAEAKRVYRTVYLSQRNVDQFPDVDRAQLPITVYSSTDNHDFARSDLEYLRSDEHGKSADAWMETRLEHPWERVND